MKMTGAKDASHGWTLIDILVVIVVIAVLAGFILLPSSGPRAKGKAVRINCASNLKQIGMAFRTWEENHNDRYPMLVRADKGGSMEYVAANEVYRNFQIMSNELGDTRLLLCPADKRKRVEDFSILRNTNISYFVALDADETLPGMPLAGDRNLTTNNVPVGPGLLVLNATNSVGWSEKIHEYAGNVGLADGSVQQVTSSGLQQLAQRSGTNTIRLAIP